MIFNARVLGTTLGKETDVVIQQSIRHFGLQAVEDWNPENIYLNSKSGCVYCR